ncbi:helix-turn-helix domain-containing protein [Thermoanaerobacter uzonensis]|uniref:helix-turn-helix domain-containing protein n=1 Tax=Thermoanaerobacter uzonensis TaxID=447593 RepID=UPI003D768270
MIEWRLHIKMAEKRMRMTDLAKASGVSRVTIHRLYKGDVTGVEMETLNRLCKALECQPGDLMVYVPDKERL